MPAPMTAKCLAFELEVGFDVDFEGETERRDGLDDGDAEVAEAGWLFDSVVVGLTSEVFGLRLRFICSSPKVIVEPTVCTVMALA
jgi:hypothetical protein